jgi:N-hydroxyarylamine O-acetyltransferase
MNLQLYLDRVGVRGAVKPDLDTLRRVHRAHAEALTYENLDVQLGVPVTRDSEASFDKIVRRRRGGWCYEMNGLLGWALEEIGFDVTRLAGAVMRDAFGDGMTGNHLVLLVRLEGRNWIGDVGFGDGLIDPAPLKEGATRGNPFECRLQCLEDGWWRYHNDPRTGGPNFDFNSEIADEGLLESRCQFLQRDPASPFVQNAVVQRWKGAAHWSMRGRVLRVLTPEREEKSLIASADDYVGTLRTAFDLDLPQAASLWPKICARHDEIFADRNPLDEAPAMSIDDVRAAFDRLE